MNSDAREAALGLLSMVHNYLSQPTPSTSSATLNSILTTTASPVIPQKRKQGDLDQPEFLQLPQSYFHLAHSPPPEPSLRSNGAESNDREHHDTSTEDVDCICGFAVDDGFSIACDECSRWCHSACFDIAPGSVPEKFACWTCKPRPAVEKEKAVRLQRERLGMADGQRRRTSPGLERKQRKGPNSSASASAATASVDGGGPAKRKQRPSITQQPPTPTVTQTTPNVVLEEEQVDIDNEPWRESYVHIVHDLIPNDDTRTKLRQQATHWRGVTAVSLSPQIPAIVPSSSLESPPPVSVKPLSPHSSLNPFLSQNSNPLVLPPAFSLHTTQAITSHSFIAPFRSCIAPSSTYLADPLNAYAHLGMPKPYVHLLGPPLDLALDARIVGNHGRFARWGCKPNAVLRPIICDRGSKETDDESTLGFGVFATKDMKANEEIVLGWEWDDGNAVHLLPALLESPATFPLITSLSSNRPHKIQHIKNQMSNILHALSSTFTTCACGALSKDCALTQMAAFVDGHDLRPLLRRLEQSNELDSEDTAKIDIGPLVGRKRGFRTRERVPHSGGLGGMRMVDDEDIPENGRAFIWDGRRPYKEGIARSAVPNIPPLSSTPTKTGIEQVLTVGEEIDAPSNVGESSKLSSVGVPLPTLPSEPFHDPPSTPTEPRPPDPPDGDGEGDDEAEEHMPPKMRKKWMHRELEARRQPSAKVGLGITFDSQDQHQLMPPPPMPASVDPTTITSTSFRPAPNQQRPISQRLAGAHSSSTDPTAMSPPSSASPLASFALLSLLSPGLNSNISRYSEPQQGKPETYSQEDSKADIVEANQAESSVADVISPEANSSTIIVSSAESATDGDLIEDDVNDLSSNLAPGFSRNLAIYSRRHDEDDEVDYSPHSPEPLSNMDEESRITSDPPAGTDFISRSVLDHRESYPEGRADVRMTSTSTLPPSTASPTSPRTTKSTSGLTVTIPEQAQPSPKPPFQELPQSQPPPPKVKLTLKDFALRRKRQREEQALSQTNQVSPVTPSPLLEGDEEVKSSDKTPQEVSWRRGFMNEDDPQGSSSFTSNVPYDVPTIHNTTSASQDNRSNQSPLSPTGSFPKSAPATLGSNGESGVPPSDIQPSRPPLLLPPRPVKQHPVISKISMKQEVTETSLLQRVSGLERSVSPISPDPVPMVNHISQKEEGEIGETPRHFASGSSSKREPNSSEQLSRNGPPFSHTPPTAPRYHLNPPTSPSSLRPTAPSMSPTPSTPANNTNGNRPNLPTGPRALRQSMYYRSGSGPPPPTTPNPSTPSQNNPPGSSFIPRAPAYDRDKERDRFEREQRPYRAPPRRGVGSGRGTPWGR